MKWLQNFAILSFLSVGLVACGEKTNQETDAVVENDVPQTEQTEQKNDVLQGELAKADFEIEGMSCAIGCAAVIEKKLASLDGVKEAKVDFDSKKAEVIYDDAKQNATTLQETVEKVADGETYKVKNIHTEKAEEV